MAHHLYSRRKHRSTRSQSGPSFVSVSTRFASAWAHSTNTASLSRASACSGVFDRSRRTTHTFESGLSNVISIGYGLVRWNQTYRPRLYRSGPVVSTHFALLA